MTRLWTTLVGRLRPSATDLETLARHETDPSKVARFQPIARGPAVAILTLMALGALWLLWVPWRAIRPRR